MQSDTVTFLSILLFNLKMLLNLTELISWPSVGQGLFLKAKQTQKPVPELRIHKESPLIPLCRFAKQLVDFFLSRV